MPSKKAPPADEPVPAEAAEELLGGLPDEQHYADAADQSDSQSLPSFTRPMIL
ncbi:hypothetical protein [Streptomyces phaeochromogenes]